MKIIIPITMLLLSSLLMISCQKSDQHTGVVGKWKLTTAQVVFFDPQQHDYSDNNIIYDFRTHGKLIVTSDLNEYMGLPPGEYSYELSPSFIHEGIAGNTLKINHSSAACTISGSSMVLDSSPLDGPILNFIRTR